MSGPRFGIVGPGEIAGVFASAIASAGTGQVTRVLGRTRARAEALAQRHGARAVEGLDELLDPSGDDAPQAIYIATPHPFHAEPAHAALERGVAVLCEKPLTTSLQDTTALVAHARESGTPLMEGWMYRTHPQMQALLALVALAHVERGDLGRALRVEAEFAFAAPFDARHRLFSPELGGGAILDVGGYPLSFALTVARAAAGGEPDVLEGARIREAHGQLATTGVDADAHALLVCGELEAQLSCAIARAGGCRARVLFEHGEAWLEHPFLPEGERRGLAGSLHVRRADEHWAERHPAAHDCFALEAEALAELVARRRGSNASSAPHVSPDWPLVDHAESLAIARLQESWRDALGAGSPR